MKSKVWRAFLQDFVGRNRYPDSIDLYLVVVIDLSPRGRATIRQIAARGIGIGAFETSIKTLMPFVVVMAQNTFLGRNFTIEKNRKEKTKACNKGHDGSPKNEPAPKRINRFQSNQFLTKVRLGSHCAPRPRVSSFNGGLGAPGRSSLLIWQGARALAHPTVSPSCGQSLGPLSQGMHFLCSHICSNFGRVRVLR